MGLKLKSTNGTGSVELNAPDNHNINTSFTLPTSNFTGGEWVLADGSGNVNIDSGTLYVDAVNDRVGVGTASPGATLDSAGDVRLSLTNSQSRTLAFHNTSSNTAFATINYDDTSGGLTFANSYQIAFNTNSNGAGGAASGATESARIDSSGNVLVGTADGNFASGKGLKIADATAARIKLCDTDTGVGSTDGMDISFTGVDGYIENRENGALIVATNNTERMRIDSSGNVGVNLNPSGNAKLQVNGSFRIAGSGSASDSSSPLLYRISGQDTLAISTSSTERMRITSGGYFKASNTGSYNNTAGNYHEFMNNNGGLPVLTMAALNASFASDVFSTGTYRSNGSFFSCAKFFSGNGSTNAYSDTEFNLRGDGNGYCDSSWVGGGADYAEYFEWSDGNTTAEDRRGISVVLDGDKIREAVAGDEPIGVISGNPSVVGDGDIDKWKGKYLRDDFGTYIREDCEVEDEDGNTVVQQCRVLNPEYDPDQEYVSRENRPEWDTVGLMGKLRIRKGQVTGSRWIKMRDISDTVEEWLVR
jgi:hypothetical protein